MHVRNKQPIIARDKDIFWLDITVHLFFRVDLGDTAQNQENKPLLFNLAHQVRQPMNLLCQIVANVLSKQNGTLFNLGWTRFVVKQNVGMATFGLEVLLFLFHLVLKMLKVLVKCYLFECFKDNRTFIFVRKEACFMPRRLRLI